MRRISVRIPIILLIALAIAFILGVGGAFYNELTNIRQLAVQTTQEVMLEGQEEKLKVAVHSMALAIGQAIRDVPELERKV